MYPKTAADNQWLMLTLAKILLFAMLSLTPLLAQDHGEDDDGRDNDRHTLKKRWTIRFYGLGADADFDSGRWQGTDDDGVGLGVSGEFRLSPLVGLESSLLVAGFDNDHHPFGDYDNGGDVPFDHHGGGDSAVAALTFGTNFHLTLARVADFHIGPMVGIMAYGHDDHHHDHHDHHGDWDDWDWDWDWDHDDDDDDAVAVAYGLNLGVDIALNREKTWVFYCALKSLRSFADVNDHHHSYGNDHHDHHGNHDHHDLDDFLDDTDWDFGVIGFGYKF